MTINSFVGPTFPVHPLNNITPFTYRDGYTYLEVLDELRGYLSDVVDAFNVNVDWINERLVTLTSLAESAETAAADVAAIFDELKLNGPVVSVDGEFGFVVLDWQGKVYTFAQEMNARNGVLNVLDFGAIADYGVGDTDNSPAFEAAIAACPVGGTLNCPPGVYKMSRTVIINKTMTFVAASGGRANTADGVKLVFPPDVDGMRITAGGGPLFSRFRVSGFHLFSESNMLGVSIGLFCDQGMGVIEDVTCEFFGSHGFHVKSTYDVATQTTYGNTANNEYHRLRAFSNGGDGIRSEGNNANACNWYKPNVVSNAGWGINFTDRSGANVIIGPHAYQIAFNSPGSFRDAGNSNQWIGVYSEAGVPNPVFLIAASSFTGTLTCGRMGMPNIVTENVASKTSWFIQRDGNLLAGFRLQPLDSAVRWNWGLNPMSTDSLDLVNETAGNVRVMSVNASGTDTRWGTEITPMEDAVKSLGSSTKSWLNAFISNYLQMRNTATPSVPPATGSRMYTRLFGGKQQLIIVFANGTTKIIADDVLV